MFAIKNIDVLNGPLNSTLKLTNILSYNYAGS
jgi:hypothetical protein